LTVIKHTLNRAPLAAVLSVDLAYKTYRDVGVVALSQESGEVRCDLVQIPLTSEPVPDRLAEYLVEYCEESNICVLLLDGPQGWKSESNGLVHSRCCERELNTPAKSGLPGHVKPENYRPFVEFSIAVFDALSLLGWNRMSSSKPSATERNRTAVESFPLSAWRSLGIKALPSKAKASPFNLQSSLAALIHLTPLRVSGNPSHDELQAIVAGLAGLALQRNELGRCAVAGIPPSLEGGVWREGLIVNPTPGVCDILSQPT
jgi:hypothetical protein